MNIEKENISIINDNPKYRKRNKDTDSFYTNAQLKYNYLDNSYLILGGDYSKAKVKEDTWATSKKGEKKVYYQSHSDIDFEAIGGYILINTLIITLYLLKELELKKMNLMKIKQHLILVVK